MSEPDIKKVVVRRSFEKVINVANVSTWYCGYIGLPKSHPLYGVDFFDGNFAGVLEITHCGNLINIDKNIEEIENTAVQNTLASDEPINDYWWVGFDTNHSWSTGMTADQAVVMVETLANHFLDNEFIAEFLSDEKAVCIDCHGLGTKQCDDCR